MGRPVSFIPFPRLDSPRSLSAFLWAAVTLVNALVCGMVGVLAFQNRSLVESQATLTVENLSRILEENLSGFLGKIDLSLHAVEAEIRRQSVQGEINEARLNAFVRLQDDHLPEALGIRIVDAKGTITNAPDSADTHQKVSIGDMDHFLRLKNGPSDVGLVISQPLLGRLTGKWLIAMGRRHENPDGSFAGEVQVSVPVEHFRHLFSGLNLGRDGTVTLYDTRPVIIARYPDLDRLGNLVGSTSISPRLRAFMASGEPTELVHVASPVDGVMRTVFYRKIGKYPFYLVVGMSDQDIYAEWWQSVIGMVGLAGLFMLLSVVFARIVHRNWDELREKNVALAHSNSDLEQFAYVASHDLQTPLRNVVRYSQLLERRYKGRFDSDADDFIGFIVDSGKQMARMINDLLEFSRVSSQSKPLYPTPASEAVAQALHNLGGVILDADAEVAVGNLPTVMAEQSHLISLFQNLVGNGLKYRAPDRKPRLSVTAERTSPEYWRFAIADNGIGIDPAYHQKIFEMFQRLTPAAEAEGSGIGLTLCRRIVHRFGGSIWVESKPGEGATFFFTLRDGAAA